MDNSTRGTHPPTSTAATAASLSTTEKRALGVLMGIYALRMFGLFLLLPVLAISAWQFEDANVVLIGLALGIYGLSQALLQLPFGVLSDRYGRKRIILLGLGLFMLGSLVAALADSLLWLIVGRALQGSGAISAVVLALTADLTRPRQRTKAMALIGVSIGCSFLAALVVAPPLVSYVGLRGVFWCIAGLTLVAMLLLLWLPQTTATPPRATPAVGELLSVFGQPQLVRLNLGIFLLHLMLTALFVAIPSQLLALGTAALRQHWQYYAPVLLLSGLTMLPLIRLASDVQQTDTALKIAIGLLALALLWEATLGTRGIGWLLCGLWLFFSGFNALEAILPSLVSQVVPAERKGAAMGGYNTCQFLGMFCGGALGGWLMSRYAAGGVFGFCALLAGGWLVLEWFTAARNRARTDKGTA